MFKYTESPHPYKLIIIDDEPVILQRFSALFHWENYGFQLCGTFSSSIAALNYLYTNSVDLIVCDIRMPQKTGFDIAQYCYEACPNSWFIFISAYQDFQYAQTAVKYNVIDYLTKPLDFQAFENALQRAHTKISSQPPDPLKLSNSYARQQLFSYLVWNNISNTELLESSIKLSGLRSDILLDECALLTVRFNNSKDNIISKFKSIESLCKGILFFLPYSNEVVLVMIRYSFDFAEFLCLKKSEGFNFESSLQKYIEELVCKFSDFLSLSIISPYFRIYPSFDELRNSVLSKNNNHDTHLSIIEKVTEYVSKHYSEDISLQTVAKHVSLSPVYFSAYFKKHTGENFITYLRNVRLEKALDYLKNTSIPVESICKQVGYDNITYFYKLVKSYTNMTPNGYRDFWRSEKNTNEIKTV